MRERLVAMLEPVVTAMGYELVHVELVGGGRDTVLRVYIDAPDGISLADCEAVSHQIGGVLDVEDPVPGGYQLEVSSPGLDRPLVKAGDFERFAGHRVRVRLSAAVDGRRKYTGELLGCEDSQVMLAVDGERHVLALDDIDSARLVPETQGPGLRRQDR